MASSALPRHDRSLAADADRLDQLFGTEDVLPLWIAEPYVPLAPEIRSAIEERAHTGWYGYEARPQSILDAFWRWMHARHGWHPSDLITSVSPSVGTSIGVMIDRFTGVGDGVILQPPVFTDFKPLVTSAGRTVVKNPLVLEDGRYRMDLSGLAHVAAHPSTRLMILCNPHNPVGRAWTFDELHAVARVCAEHDVLVLSDEIHADLMLRTSVFTPFAVAAEGTGVRWAATHGPVKTFGLAGVCDTLLITDRDAIAEEFRSVSRRLHLTRNNVFALAAFETAYQVGDDWLDGFLDLVTSNTEVVRSGLREPLALVEPEATFLAWLDLRGLGLGAPELASAIAAAGVALSPGHWFGREGAGFGRLTIAAASSEIGEAVHRINRLIS